VKKVGHEGCGSLRTIDLKRTGPSLEREGHEEAGQAEIMVAMEMGEKDTCKTRLPDRTQHLALSTLSAIEEEDLGSLDNG
jgi:hypothetical protein